MASSAAWSGRLRRAAARRRCGPPAGAPRRALLAAAASASGAAAAAPGAGGGGAGGGCRAPGGGDEPARPAILGRAPRLSSSSSDRRGEVPRAEEGARQLRGEPPVLGAIEPHQHALHLGQDVRFLGGLLLEPRLFLVAHRHAGERPAQQRRHAERGDHGHEHDDREEPLIQHAHAQADGRQDHLGGAARIHGEADRQRFAMIQARRAGAPP